MSLSDYYVLVKIEGNPPPYKMDVLHITPKFIYKGKRIRPFDCIPFHFEKKRKQQ